MILKKCIFIMLLISLNPLIAQDEYFFEKREREKQAKITAGIVVGAIIVVVGIPILLIAYHDTPCVKKLFMPLVKCLDPQGYKKLKRSMKELKESEERLKEVKKQCAKEIYASQQSLEKAQKELEKVQNNLPDQLRKIEEAHNLEMQKARENRQEQQGIHDKQDPFALQKHKMKEMREKLKIVQEFTKDRWGDKSKKEQNIEEFKKFLAMNIDQRIEYIESFKKIQNSGSRGDGGL